MRNTHCKIVIKAKMTLFAKKLKTLLTLIGFILQELAFSYPASFKQSVLLRLYLSIHDIVSINNTFVIRALDLSM